MIIFISSMICYFSFYIIFVEILIIKTINSQLIGFRTIFNLYMPQDILLREKRIRYWLIKNDLLSK